MKIAALNQHRYEKGNRNVTSLRFLVVFLFNLCLVANDWLLNRHSAKCPKKKEVHFLFFSCTIKVILCFQRIRGRLFVTCEHSQLSAVEHESSCIFPSDFFVLFVLFWVFFCEKAILSPNLLTHALKTAMKRFVLIALTLMDSISRRASSSIVSPRGRPFAVVGTRESKRFSGPPRCGGGRIRLRLLSVSLGPPRRRWETLLKMEFQFSPRLPPSAAAASRLSTAFFFFLHQFVYPALPPPPRTTRCTERTGGGGGQSR